MANHTRPTLAILRRRAVEARTGLSRTTIYDLANAGNFPKPVRLGARAVGWLESEVDAWLAAQVRLSRGTAA